jgi:hypothetical protein
VADPESCLRTPVKGSRPACTTTRQRDPRFWIMVATPHRQRGC